MQVAGVPLSRRSAGAAQADKIDQWIGPLDSACSCCAGGPPPVRFDRTRCGQNEGFTFGQRCFFDQVAKPYPQTLTRPPGLFRPGPVHPFGPFRSGRAPQWLGGGWGNSNAPIRSRADRGPRRPVRAGVQIPPGTRGKRMLALGMVKRTCWRTRTRRSV